mmetsp:Transcript_48035/g.154983  ORF Transcript_48035/g.154983 Transcript_48035/m.154983 type:complete len:81 (-) Transcript_48035:582-824(-)
MRSATIAMMPTSCVRRSGADRRRRSIEEQPSSDALALRWLVADAQSSQAQMRQRCGGFVVKAQRRMRSHAQAREFCGERR